MSFLRRLVGRGGGQRATSHADDRPGPSADRAGAPDGGADTVDGGAGTVDRSGTSPGPASTPDTDATPSGNSSRRVDDELPADEVERERALLRADAKRLDDDLLQRQLRYADRAWTPPRQGGERRADDGAEGSS